MSIGGDDDLFAPIPDAEDDDDQYGVVEGDSLAHLKDDEPQEPEPLEEDEAPALPELPAEDDNNDEGDDDDREPVNYSKAVRKRIQRVERARQEEVAARDAQINELTARLQDSSAQVHKLQKLTHLGWTKVAENKIKALTAEVQAASEAGDHAKMAELQSQLAAAHAEKAEIERWGGTIPEKPEPVRVKSVGVQAKATQWMAANSSWYGKPGYEQETQWCRDADDAIARRGYKPDTREYWTALNKELRKISSIAKLVRDVGQTAPKVGNTRGMVTSGGSLSASDGQQAVRRATNGQVRVNLTADDVRGMRMSRMDPQNPAHRKAWAAAKLEMDSRERRGK